MLNPFCRAPNQSVGLENARSAGGINTSGSYGGLLDERESGDVYGD